MLDAKYVIYGHYQNSVVLNWWTHYWQRQFIGNDCICYRGKNPIVSTNCKKNIHTCDGTTDNNTAKLILKKSQNV